MKELIYISRLEYLENGITNLYFVNIKSIRIIDPKHEESILISTECYLKCIKDDLICLIIQY